MNTLLFYYFLSIHVAVLLLLDAAYSTRPDSPEFSSDASLPIQISMLIHAAFADNL
jgi:hypothetical protein